MNRHRSRNAQARACGCFVIFAGLLAIAFALGAIAIPALPSLVIRFAGFQPLNPATYAGSNDIPPAIITAESAGDIAFLLPAYGAVEIPADVTLDGRRGIDESGAEILQVWFGEQQIQALCVRFAEFCCATGAPVRKGQIQLSAGRIQVSGEAYVDLLNRWQPAQLVVDIAQDKWLNVSGIVLAGTSYSVPDNALGRIIREWQGTVNQALRGMSARHRGRSFVLSAIDITGETLVATFR